MKKWLSLFLLFAVTTGFSEPLQNRSLNQITLAKLASDLGLSGDLLEQTQQHWYQAKDQGKERWQISEIRDEHRALAIQWAQENAMFGSWEPVKEHYDSALILGSSTPVMRERLKHLVSLWNKGVRFDEVVWLTGERPLDAKIDHLCDRCSNESEGARVLWEEACIPEEMRQLAVHFVSVPMKLIHSEAKRPNTKDTIVMWMETAPEAKSALFVSNQPFCGYQHAVIEGSLDKSIDFDVVGQGVNPELIKNHPLAGALILDTAAKWLYQETCNRRSK
jgi:hypothetical protein